MKTDYNSGDLVRVLQNTSLYKNFYPVKTVKDSSYGVIVEKIDNTNLFGVWYKILYDNYFYSISADDIRPIENGNEVKNGKIY